MRQLFVCVCHCVCAMTLLIKLNWASIDDWWRYNLSPFLQELCLPELADKQAGTLVIEVFKREKYSSTWLSLEWASVASDGSIKLACQ